MDSVKTIDLTDIRPHRFFLNRIHTRKSWSFPRHRHHDVFEFYYLFEGSLKQIFDDRVVEMQPGDWMAVGEQEFHSLKGRGFGFYNLILPVEDWREFLKFPELEKAYNQLLGSRSRLHVNVPPEKRALVMNLLDELFLYQKKSYGDLLLQKFLITLIADLSEPKGLLPASTLPPWLEMLLELSKTRLEEGLTPRMMADLCQRSPEHMARSFRKFLGMSPSAWLNEQKLLRASLLLEHSNTPVLDIALSLGYGNLNYFYKLFTARFGLPPGEYRKRQSLLHQN